MKLTCSSFACCLDYGEALVGRVGMDQKIQMNQKHCCTSSDKYEVVNQNLMDWTSGYGIAKTDK